MNGWLVLQLGVDILIFAFIIFIVFKDVLKKKKGKPVDATELRLILEEIDQSMNRNALMAKKIQQELKEQTNIMAVQEAVKRKKATASLSNRPEQLPLRGREDEPDVDVKAPNIKVLSDRKRNVKTLFKQGISNEGISERLSIPLPEVELIITMIGES